MDADSFYRKYPTGNIEYGDLEFVSTVGIPSTDIPLSSARREILDRGDLSLYEVGELNDVERLYYAEVKLGSLDNVQKQAILDMHYMEEGTGDWRILNKMRENEGRISSEDVRVLMETGITGIQRNAENALYGGGQVRSAMALDIHNTEAQRVMSSIYFREYGYSPSSPQLREFMRPHHETGEMAVMISDYYVDEVRNNKGKLIEAARQIFIQENPKVNPGKSQVLEWINSQNEDKLKGIIIDYLNEGY